MNRSLAALLACLASPIALAQVAPSAPATPPATCAECGIVRTVKRIEVPQPYTADDRRAPSGLVASVPLGGGKPIVGSSTDVRNELKPPLVRYEITVQMDNGRLQLVTQDDLGGLREGDKVKVDRGQVALREK